MKIFKVILDALCRIGTFGFGFASYDLFVGDYKRAAWVLFVVSFLYWIRYIVEQLSD